MSNPKRVLVVGGGVTGLAAAVELLDDARVQVEVWEADSRLGGKIATTPFGGAANVDEGADAFLTRVPYATEYCARIGVDVLTAPQDSSAAVWHNGLHDIPAGIVLGVPASISPFITTGLLSMRGKLRAAAEPFLPRTDAGDSLGALIRARFGAEVHERLVDALIGSIYATDTDRFSLAAVPQLADIANSNRSLLIGARSMRRRSTATSVGTPIFGAPLTGMNELIAASAKRIEARGGVISTNRPVVAIEPDGSAFRASGERFDSVILATPATMTGCILATVAPSTADQLVQFEHADVIIVRLAIPSDQWPTRLHGLSGYLVPKSVQRLVTAVSFGSQKWGHWRTPDGSQILRVSLGRDGLPVMHLDDETIVAATLEEVGRHLQIDLQPAAIAITRWPGAFPQYRPLHHSKVAGIALALPANVHVAGASYNGIGIPACIADGLRAARRLRSAIDNSD